MTNKIKCNTEIHNFMENYKYGFNPLTTEMGVLKYHDFEKKIVNLINDNQFSIILKGRGVYVSTVLVAYATWQILNGKKIGLFMNKNNFTKNFLSKVRTMLFHYSINNVVNFKDDKTNFIELDNGGLIKGLTTLDSARGVTFDELIYDGAAFIDRFEEIYNIMSTTLLVGVKTIIASSPNGMDHFYRIWEASIKKSNDFKRIKITYKDIPNRDEKWLETIKRIMNYDERTIREELYAEFLPPLQKKIKKNKLIQFRLNDDLFNKLSMKLIENDVNISAYMRGLIIKDVNG